MSDHADFDENASNRTFTAPYTSNYPIPTVQRYHERRQHRREVEQNQDIKKEEGPDGQGDGQESYNSYNRNAEEPTSSEGSPQREHQGENRGWRDDGYDGAKEDTQQSIESAQDPRQKRKNMKHMKRDRDTRQVTDPVTHLPVTIHDFTEKELKNVPRNLPPANAEPRSSTGFSAASKSSSQLDTETNEAEAEHRGMERLFPPPDFYVVKDQFISIYQFALTIGLSVLVAVFIVIVIVSHLLRGRLVFQSHQTTSSWLSLFITSTTLLLIGGGLGGSLIWGLREWLDNKASDIWDDEVWEASRAQEQDHAESPTPESTHWLNSLVTSIWPLINPDLFASLADTLEDVMQASLPKMVRMISVEDLGQGSEAIRILGIKILPTGAASKSVSVDGKIKSTNGDSDRIVPGEGEVDEDPKPQSSEKSDQSKKASEHDSKEDGQQENIAEGMEAEEGDFVNVEIAFSYRASSSGKGIKKKAKNAHLFLAFYLPGGLKFPVWVELKGIVGIMRMRLQLCPDPPFFSLCTLTLLGQPKANMSCVPLTKHGLNIMDIPLISNFVQSSIDAALAEIVSPKSLTLDLKDMLVGDDFKKDTSARGMLMVKIKKASKFKEGDGSLGGLTKGSSDPYVAVGWAKFGKPVWSTRVILSDMEPIWEETAFLLVSPQELNADERLRIQLWDSDRTSADDDLGRIEVDLKELMHDNRSKGNMWDRDDGFIAMDAGETMPGSLEWSVGYFPKLRIQGDQIVQQTAEPEIENTQQLKDKVSDDAEKKLQEATAKERSIELEQQKAQDLKNREDVIITYSPPPATYPTGIFSIEIHNITGLQYESLNKSTGEGEEGNDTEEGNVDLPSSYCTVILNQQMIFRTRTKPKNSKPFFNAGTERIVRDWGNTEVMISVRDSRIHEDDPLLGIVYLPLCHFLHNRSQINDTFPLVGGIGYGRIRVSMVFRSCMIQLPRELLGWDYGTLEITGPILAKDLATDLQPLRLKLRTSVNHEKMYSIGGDRQARWVGKRDRRVHLAVRKRFSSCLVIEFRKNSAAFDKTPAFAILWFKDIPDDEEKTVILPVWRGNKDMKRAEKSCLDNVGEKAGTLEIPLKLWHGLSRYHKRLTSKNPNLHDIFEVLDTARDNKEVREFMDCSDDSDSDDSDGEEGKENRQGSATSDEYDKHNQENGRRGPIDQIKDYKDHRQQLHRQHRGVMQYKGARTAQWMKTKVEHGKDHILSTFKHHERDPGIETEV